MKNALSPYKLGGAGGGSDFDPKGRSENEDLPAEDMGVGPREMGYLFGRYRRLAGNFQGNFTGPKIFWSGSSLRTEATGYGLIVKKHARPYNKPIYEDFNCSIFPAVTVGLAISCVAECRSFLNSDGDNEIDSLGTSEFHLRIKCPYFNSFGFLSQKSKSKCVVSGAGKIAMHVLEKLLACGAIPITISGSV
ncbi:NADP-specific glutamate dehydrogenase [Dendrobium catenatum]|uniref:NADP-specific glutamate dehydrogenase n=1 Tax=Dendrobium catenatum TaxID=906689 RepID=A0A2I0WEU9_9ASPA|nr:NADP-specific glutamate dehydrogenase [Dendrobium catenatum]